MEAEPTISIKASSIKTRIETEGVILVVLNNTLNMQIAEHLLGYSTIHLLKWMVKEIHLSSEILEKIWYNKLLTGWCLWL